MEVILEGATASQKNFRPAEPQIGQPDPDIADASIFASGRRPMRWRALPLAVGIGFLGCFSTLFGCRRAGTDHEGYRQEDDNPNYRFHEQLLDWMVDENVGAEN